MQDFSRRLTLATPAHWFQESVRQVQVSDFLVRPEQSWCPSDGHSLASLAQALTSANRCHTLSGLPRSVRVSSRYVLKFPALEHPSMDPILRWRMRDRHRDVVRRAAP